MGAEVQAERLKGARREPALEAAIGKLERYGLLILDDIADLPRDHAETAARSERRSRDPAKGHQRLPGHIGRQGRSRPA